MKFFVIHEGTGTILDADECDLIGIRPTSTEALEGIEMNDTTTAFKHADFLYLNLGKRWRNIIAAVRKVTESAD